ncbi:MAG TPA: mechanosensitive ion channel domain-containing protein [Nordella sp.]|nr:mechanosensitive ion channel domain-containing protein [Nordella sp.]
MTIDQAEIEATRAWDILFGWLVSAQFYAQIGAIILAVALAHFANRQIKAKTPYFKSPPEQGAFLKARRWLYSCRDLLFPILCVLMLAIAVQVAEGAVGSSWLVRIAQSIAVIGVLYAAIKRFIRHPLINAAARWIGIPIATLQVFGVLDNVSLYLDSVSLEAGNIRLSLYTLAKAAVFGGVLFWLGRLSNDAGQRAIRKQETLDIPTRELLAKIFQIGLFVLLFILLLQVLGLDLTALTIFGGALGVGLGFGLQQIASNFISGMILLFERSMKVGDYVEVGGGMAGTLREINMRSSTLHTGDGKEIMVPNEKFITSAFVNWTKSDPLQRFEVTFSVPYDADIHKIPDLIQVAAAKHPHILARPSGPSCDIKQFGDKGIQFALSYWVMGSNGYGSDVHFLVWDTLKDAGIALGPLK